MMQLNEAEWELLRDGFADISCWFMGFKAAHIDSSKIEFPPQLREVQDLMNKLKQRVLDK